MEEGRVKNQATSKKGKHSERKKQSMNDKSHQYIMPQTPLERVKSIYSKSLQKAVEGFRNEKEKEKSHSLLSQCKFCGMISCKKYFSPETRREHCRELRTSFKCSSLKHLSNKYPAKKYGHSISCRKCGNRTNIAAVCYSGYSDMTSGSFTDSQTSHSVTTENELASSSHIIINAATATSQNIFRPSPLQ